MKTIYTRYETSNLLEDLGQDVVHFKIYFRTDELPEVRFGILFPYRELVYFVKETNQPAYEYLTGIRSSIAGYGPKETKVLAKIAEEGFDVEPFIMAYLESKDAVFISQHLEWIERLNAPEAQRQASKALESISNAVGENYAREQIKGDKYRDELDQTIHELTFRYFPDLFEMGEEKIKAYQNALIATTIDFTDKLDRIINTD
ncbi:hypothetical protein [Flavobacterium sp. SM2513]|uniref:hypothetical protein n=1 Tax=Flavobacterium sp. SM2513 TaxID=3424766 RepID=UPI003D7FAF57